MRLHILRFMLQNSVSFLFILIHEKQNINEQQNRTDDYTAIGKIKNCKIYEPEIQKIHNIVTENPINQIADTTA